MSLEPGVDRGEVLKQAVAASGAVDDGVTLLSDSRSGIDRFDRAEDAALGAWSGPRLSVKEVLGESFGAAAGLQLVAAVEAVRRGKAAGALISVLGGGEQAGACLIGKA